MYPLVPTNILEVAQVMAWRKQQGETADEDQIIIEAIKENAQNLIDEALEGPYWTIKWENEDHLLAVFDVMGEKIGELSPAGSSFSAEFRKNGHELLLHLGKQLRPIIGSH